MFVIFGLGGRGGCGAAKYKILIFAWGLPSIAFFKELFSQKDF